MQPSSEQVMVKGPQRRVSPEEFAFETRFVVLNYLGHIQARSSSESSFSSSGGSSGHRLQTQSSSSSGSSHVRPSSVSPRQSSQGSTEGDPPTVVGAQAYDAKLKAVQAIAQRGKAQDAKRRVNDEILRKGHITDHLKNTGEQEVRKRSTDVADGITEDGRRRISEILEKKSREARVLEELKNLAKARIDEIRLQYESLDNLDEKDYSQYPRDGKSDEDSSSFTTQSGMLPQGLPGVMPFNDNTPSPGIYDFLGGPVPFVNQRGGGFGDRTDLVTSPLSPTRPSNLDGLDKTSDILEEPGKSKVSPRRKPKILAQVRAESLDSTVSKRGDIPRPPAPPLEKRDTIPKPAHEKKRKERSPNKRDGIPRPPSQEQRASEDSDLVVYPISNFDREFSEESEYSVMDSPLSDLSTHTFSGRSVISATTSSRSSVVSMNESQVKALVKTSVLPEVALPLQEEIHEQWQHWEREYEQASQSSSLAGMSPMMSSTGLMSPESEVARKLGIIGDRIQEEMGDLLDKAFNDVMAIPREQVTYEVLTRVVEDDQLLQHSSGWKQVAVLLAFSQRLTLGLLQKGERGLGKLMDYSVRLIEDKAAEFIINQGGWGAISELDVSPLVSPSADNPDFTLDIPDLPLGAEVPVDRLGINAAGTLLENPNEAGLCDTALGRTSGIYISDTFGSRAVGGYFGEELGAVGGVGTSRLMVDGPTGEVDTFENGVVLGSEYPLGQINTPDLLTDSMYSSEGVEDYVRPEIQFMRSISHELSREAEEAQTHRLVNRITWGSLAVIAIAVGLTLLWKWKPQKP